VRRLKKKLSWCSDHSQQSTGKCTTHTPSVKKKRGTVSVQ
jgi:hypothetical protein